MLLTILASLALAAAASLRTSLALFCLALVSFLGDYTGPLAPWLAHPVTVALLCFWAAIEVVAARTFLGGRLIQSVQFFVAPFAGIAMVAVFTPSMGAVHDLAVAAAGGAVATILQVVYMGAFFRRGRLPHHFQFLKESLCVALVLLALGMPSLAGLVVFVLLWLALQQAYHWRQHFNRPGSICLG